MRALLLYGYHPVREALRHRPHRLARVLVSATRLGRRRQEIEDLCRRHRVPCEVVPDRALAARAGPAHNGLAAELKEDAGQGEDVAGNREAASLERDAARRAGEVPGPAGEAASWEGDAAGPVEQAAGRRVGEAAGPLRGAGGRQSGAASRLPEDGTGGSAADMHELEGDPSLLVLLEDVQDPRNLGAVLRVCEGAGVGRVLIRDRGSAPITPAVAKTAAGATEWLPIERITNSAATIEALKKEGFWAYGTDPAGQPPWSVDLTGKLLLCFGGEQQGLRPRTRALCDATIGLPMRGHLGSLNLSTAAAAVLYEALRQRLRPPQSRR